MKGHYSSTCFREVFSFSKISKNLRCFISKDTISLLSEVLIYAMKSPKFLSLFSYANFTHISNPFQILSLNLTNLLILVFLKALIFSAGLIGAGNWGQYARGRRADSKNFYFIIYNQIWVINWNFITASFAIKPEEPQLFL